MYNIAGSIFADGKFDKEIGYDRSCKKTFQMGSKYPELFNRGAAKIGSYAFEDLLPPKWYFLYFSIPFPVSYNDIFVLKIVVLCGCVGLQQQQWKRST